MEAASDTDRVFEEKTDALRIDDTKSAADMENENHVAYEDGPDLEFKVTPRLILSILVGASMCHLLNLLDNISL
jgi:hypothetical protein